MNLIQIWTEGKRGRTPCYGFELVWLNNLYKFYWSIVNWQGCDNFCCTQFVFKKTALDAVHERWGGRRKWGRVRRPWPSPGGTAWQVDQGRSCVGWEERMEQDILGSLSVRTGWGLGCGGGGRIRGWLPCPQLWSQTARARNPSTWWLWNLQ